MDEKDLQIQQMRGEIGRLSKTLVEAIGEACLKCLKYGQIQNCAGCKIEEIKEDLNKE